MDDSGESSAFTKNPVVFPPDFVKIAEPLLFNQFLI